MKVISSIIFSVFVILTACKKDDGTSAEETTSNTYPSYKITAPSCLIETDSSASGWGRNYYDNQRRLAMRCVRLKYNTRDSVISTYTYGANTITTVTKTIPLSGPETITTTVHYLNSMGLIDSSVGTFFFPGVTSVHYLYNNSGYLIRSINYSGAKPSSGNSFQYTGGNRISIYQLTYNSETGELIDSSLSNGFTYYPEIAGNIDASWAWIDRTGRANTNARKNTLDRGGSVVMTYSYIDENGLPSTRVSTYGGNSYYTWKCN